MPYIDKESRKRYDDSIADLIDNLSQEDMHPGHINYIITRLMQGTVGDTYKDYNAAIGILECVKQEFYRRCVVPYEDQKILENGDV